MSDGDLKKIRDSAEYMAALVALTVDATADAIADDAPTFSQIDLERADDGRIVAYAYRRSDGECFVRGFDVSARKRK